MVKSTAFRTKQTKQEFLLRHLEYDLASALKSSELSAAFQERGYYEDWVRCYRSLLQCLVRANC